MSLWDFDELEDALATKPREEKQPVQGPEEPKLLQNDGPPPKAEHTWRQLPWVKQQQGDNLPCSQCGQQSAEGTMGTDEFAGQWFCNACWQSWEDQEEEPEEPKLLHNSQQQPMARAWPPTLQQPMARAGPPTLVHKSTTHRREQVEQDEAQTSKLEKNLPPKRSTESITQNSDRDDASTEAASEVLDQGLPVVSRIDLVMPEDTGPVFTQEELRSWKEIGPRARAQASEFERTQFWRDRGPIPSQTEGEHMRDQYRNLGNSGESSLRQTIEAHGQLRSETAARLAARKAALASAAARRALAPPQSGASSIVRLPGRSRKPDVQ